MHQKIGKSYVGWKSIDFKTSFYSWGCWKAETISTKHRMILFEQFQSKYHWTWLLYITWILFKATKCEEYHILNENLFVKKLG